jgi:putative endonuclease
MPVTTYALRFHSGEIYVGMTSDLGRRLEEHRRRQSPSTKKFVGEFEVIYTREYPDYQQARSHEKYLKSGAGRQILKHQDVKRPRPCQGLARSTG